MLLTIALIVLVLWLLGFSLHVGAGLIHILLIIGLIMLIAHFFGGGRRNTGV